MHSHPGQFPRTIHGALAVCAILVAGQLPAEAEPPRRSPLLPARQDSSLVAPAAAPQLLPSNARAIRADMPAAEQPTPIERGPPSSCQFPDNLASPAYDPSALVDTWPQPLWRSGNQIPVFPPESVRLGQSGTVVVRVSVNVDGKVSGISLQKSSGFVLLDAAALRAVLSWKFAPAVRHGRPVAADLLVPIQFVMPDDTRSAGQKAGGKKP